MKKLILSVCVAMFSMAAFAQITWNAKAGAGLATCWGDGELSPHVVGKAGVGIEKPLTKDISLMPSIEVAWKGAEDKWDGYKETLDIIYLQVPVLAAYRMNLTQAWNMAIKAGPYFAFKVYDKLSLGGGGEHESYSAGAESFDAGIDVGVDFERRRFVFGLEAEMGFIGMWGGNSPKNLAFYATVGWKF